MASLNLKQQDLTESAGRNVEERIKAIQKFGDGYVTIQNLTCSNLQKGQCTINPCFPELMGRCIKGTMCGFYESNFAE